MNPKSLIVMTTLTFAAAIPSHAAMAVWEGTAVSLSPGMSLQASLETADARDESGWPVDSFMFSGTIGSQYRATVTSDAFVPQVQFWTPENEGSSMTNNPAVVGTWAAMSDGVFSIEVSGGVGPYTITLEQISYQNSQTPSSYEWNIWNMPEPGRTDGWNPANLPDSYYEYYIRSDGLRNSWANDWRGMQSNPDDSFANWCGGVME